MGHGTVRFEAKELLSPLSIADGLDWGAQQAVRWCISRTRGNASRSRGLRASIHEVSVGRNPALDDFEGAEDDNNNGTGTGEQ